MSEKNERLQILEMIDNGTISPDEGARLLQALSGVPRNSESRPRSSDEPHLLDPETPFGMGDALDCSKGNNILTKGMSQRFWRPLSHPQTRISGVAGGLFLCGLAWVLRLSVVS